VAAAVVTKHDDSVARGEAARLGIGYLVKPLTRESLAETIGDGLIGRACTR
jgi:hypothetical protein